jgi:glutamyl-tRNA(Gln) amidotransferase subunit E
MVNELKINPVFIGTFFGHTLKFVEGHFTPAAEFKHEIIKAMFKYLLDNDLDLELAKKMLPVVYQHPKMDFESVLVSIPFKKMTKEEIIAKIPFLKKKFAEIHISKEEVHEKNWIMGELRRIALGNIRLKELYKLIN